MIKTNISRWVTVQVVAFTGILLIAGCAKPLRPDSSAEDLKKKIDSEIQGMESLRDSGNFDLPITTTTDDFFWVKPAFTQGQLPVKKIKNLSVSDRGLFDILQFIFDKTDVPMSFDGGPDTLSRYGSVSVSNLSGSLTDVMNKLSEMLGFFWSVTESGVLRVSPDQQFVIEMPPILSQDNMAGFTNTLKYLGAKDVFLDRINRTLVFRANRTSLGSIKGYMQEARRSRSVIVYDVNVFQVNLSDENSQGISWQTLQQSAGIGGTTVGGVAGASLTNASNSFDTVIFGRNFQLRAFLSFLESQGDVKTLSQPKLGLMNGTNGSIRVGNSTTYIARVGTQFINGASQSTAETENLETGLELSITGETHDHTIYTRISLSIRELLSLAPEQVGDLTLNLPEVADREMVTQIRSRPGDTILLGGITVAQSQGLYRDGLTEGSMNNQTSLSELVVTIRPTIIKFVSPEAKQAEMNQSSNDSSKNIENETIEATEKTAQQPDESSLAFQEQQNKEEFAYQQQAENRDEQMSESQQVIKPPLPKVDDFSKKNSYERSQAAEPLKEPPTAELLNEPPTAELLNEPPTAESLKEPPTVVAMPVSMDPALNKITVAPESVHALAVPMSTQTVVAPHHERTGVPDEWANVLPDASTGNSIAEMPLVPAPEQVAAMAPKSVEKKQQPVIEPSPLTLTVTKSSEPKPELKQPSLAELEKPPSIMENPSDGLTLDTFSEQVENLEKQRRPFYGFLIPEPDWNSKLRKMVAEQYQQKPRKQNQLAEAKKAPASKVQSKSRETVVAPSRFYGELIDRPVSVSLTPQKR